MVRARSRVAAAASELAPSEPYPLAAPADDSGAAEALDAAPSSAPPFDAAALSSGGAATSGGAAASDEAPTDYLDVDVEEEEDEDEGAVTAGATVKEGKGDDALPEGFALVESVAKGSPAERAGLRPYDRVVRLGVCTSGSGLAASLAASENVAVEVLVQRLGQQLALQLTPRQWKGNGLLGCRLLVLS